jgi:hypothetical protein
MGDISDMMIDGTLCEGCGVYLEGESFGVPRYCASCERDGCGVSTGSPTPPRPVRGKVACPTCGRHVKAAGLKDHQRAVHG